MGVSHLIRSVRARSFELHWMLTMAPKMYSILTVCRHILFRVSSKYLKPMALLVLSPSRVSFTRFPLSLSLSAEHYLHSSLTAKIFSVFRLFYEAFTWCYGPLMRRHSMIRIIDMDARAVTKYRKIHQQIIIIKKRKAEQLMGKMTCRCRSRDWKIATFLPRESWQKQKVISARHSDHKCHVYWLIWIVKDACNL